MTEESSIVLSGVRDIDVEILLRLPDETLSIVNLVCRYIRSLCDNQLWLRKLANHLGVENVYSLGTIVNGRRVYLQLNRLHSVNEQMIWIAKNGYDGILRQMIGEQSTLRPFIDLDEFGGPAINAAIIEGHLTTFKTLLNAGVSLNNRNRAGRAIWLSVVHNRVDILDDLLKAGYWRPNILFKAVEKGSLAIVNRLLEDPQQRADPIELNGNNETPIAIAKRFGHSAIVKRLAVEIEQRYRVDGLLYCVGMTKSGRRCGAMVSKGSVYCHHHR